MDELIAAGFEPESNFWKKRQSELAAAGRLLYNDYKDSKRVVGEARWKCEKNIPRAHRVGDLVVRRVETKLYLCSFIFYYNNHSFDRSLFNRPTQWLKMDFVTGQIVDVCDCTDHEFSRARYALDYNFSADEGANLTAEYYRMLYCTLDEVRIDYLRTKEFDREKYESYLAQIKANSPADMRQFFDALSRI